MDVNDVELTKSTVLRGHKGVMSACEWSPKDDLFASGSIYDSAARVWNLEKCLEKISVDAVSHELRHFVQNGDVADSSKSGLRRIAWKRDGSALATASLDGYVRVWKKDGAFEKMFGKHTELIRALKWNPKGNYILSGSEDKTAIVWDLKGGACKQKFAFHDDWITDVDWQSDNVFVSSSADGLIQVCKVGSQTPIKTLAGHTNMVNAIEFDPKREVLASASKDKTIMLWKPKSKKCLKKLEGHKKGVLRIRWSAQRHCLASASLDSTARLWDTQTGAILHTLSKHTAAVRSIAFSPDGRLLSTLSPFDGNVHIWDTKNGAVVESLFGAGHTFFKTQWWLGDLCAWNARGDKLAVGYADGTIGLYDMRKFRDPSVVEPSTTTGCFFGRK